MSIKNKKDIPSVIKACQKGEVWAQRQLVDIYADRLYALCIRYIGNRETAKDALQDSFVKIFKHIKNYNAAKGAFTPWINTVTIRLCLSLKSRDAIQDQEVLLESSNSLSVDPEILDQLSVKEILILVANLPQEYRQVFNLYCIEGYSHKAIGDLLNIKEASSRSRLSRAKEMLRKELQKIKSKESWTQVG